MAYAWVFLGGGLGSVLRLAVGKWSLAALGPAFPWGTLAVNILGSLAIGLIAGRPGLLGPDAKLLLVTGLLGGFTTFSAFSLDTLTLWQRAPGQAAAYVAATTILGLAAVALGYLIAR